MTALRTQPSGNCLRSGDPSLGPSGGRGPVLCSGFRTSAGFPQVLGHDLTAQATCTVTLARLGWEPATLQIVTLAQEWAGWRNPQRDRGGSGQRGFKVCLFCLSASRGKSVDGSWSLSASQTPGFLKNTEQRHSKLRSRYERNRTEEGKQMENTLMCWEQHTCMSFKLLLNVRYNAF